MLCRAFLLPCVVLTLLGCSNSGEGAADRAGGGASGGPSAGAAGQAVAASGAGGMATSGQGGGGTAPTAGSSGSGGGSAGAPPVQGSCEGLGALPSARHFTPKLFSAGADPSQDPECTALVNPERGFRGTTNLRASASFDGRRDEGQSTVYGAVLLDDYLEQDLDAALLERLTENFAAAREAGVKLLPRFYYQADLSASASDATRERALAHIEQLAPLLEANADVIAALHAGFVGAWGEWHGSTTELHEQEPREAILSALLGALPASRTVLVRRPSFKSLAFPGGPLSEATAFDGTDLARVGHLNDCFLASDSDSGTYQDAGEKDYAVADSAFTAVDGETCATNPPRSECESAKAELQLHHWSLLNLDYNGDVLDSWRSGGCFDEIACRLGYRLALVGHSFPETVSRGQLLSFLLSFVNDGYARPFNARPLHLVLRGPETRSFVVDLDARDLAPGADPSEHCLGVALPADLLPGTYTLGLALPDAAPGLASDERYAVQLANDVTWQDGVNWLDATLQVAE